MKDLVNLFLLGCALFAIGWFVSFQYDPYRVCVNHPTNKYLYLCKPFDFELEKGTRLERNDDDRFPWEKKGDVIIGTHEPTKRRQKQISKEQLREEYDCKPEIFLLGEEQWKNIDIDQYCKYKGPTLKTKDDATLNPENLPTLNEEL